MDFLIHSRATAAAMNAEDDPDLDERHWSYMDGHSLIARGPLLGPGRQTWAGSIHIVDLPDPDAARNFVDREPYNRAGAYEQHLIWRFTNLLGRTMSQFAGDPDELRYFVLARTARPPLPLADLASHVRERLIVYGALRDLDTDVPAGAALAVQVATRNALDTLLGAELAWLAETDDVEASDWEFGGRR